jgi:hypothetical protein
MNGKGFRVMRDDIERAAPNRASRAEDGDASRVGRSNDWFAQHAAPGKLWALFWRRSTSLPATSTGIVCGIAELQQVEFSPYDRPITVMLPQIQSPNSGA